VLNAIADAVEKNKDMLAVAESWENGKPVRETLAADIPWCPIISGTSPPRHAPRRDARLRSRRIWSPTTSGSRWAWSVRSSRSTSRC